MPCALAGAFFHYALMGLFTLSVSFMALISTGGNIRPFVRTTARDDNRYSGTQVGLLTINDNDEYRVSYLEAGMRSDHIIEPLLTRMPGHTVPTVSAPNAYDADFFANDEDKQRPVAAQTEAVSNNVVEMPTSNGLETELAPVS